MAFDDGFCADDCTCECNACWACGTHDSDLKSGLDPKSSDALRHVMQELIESATPIKVPISKRPTR